MLPRPGVGWVAFMNFVIFMVKSRSSLVVTKGMKIMKKRRVLSSYSWQ